MKKKYLIMLMLPILMLWGCAAPKFKLFQDESDPLKEFTLQGKGKQKILLIPIQGIISETPKKEFFRPRPSLVQEVVSQLQLAEKDKNIRAILLKVNSPGGTATASDILYHEFADYKNRSNVKVFVIMMDVAASGGYYLSLPADRIMAHPTTVTGSVGAIFLYPKIVGLMDKIGLQMQVSKSGKNKDMGSPFRQATTEEVELLNGLTAELGARFLDLVKQHRRLTPEAAATVATARVFTAKTALKVGLIDDIGYLTDAIKTAKTETGLPEDARVVVYRRAEYPNDNLYNPSTTQSGIYRSPLIDMDIVKSIPGYQTGIYYLWTPGME